jgi:adenylate cyclase
LLSIPKGEIRFCFGDHFKLTDYSQTCISTLAIRNMVRPFKDGMLEQACPMADILGEVASQLDELKVLRLQADFEMAPS